eukprot:12425871-Ditylum_brightwellii.AAC.1
MEVEHNNNKDALGDTTFTGITMTDHPTEINPNRDGDNYNNPVMDVEGVEADHNNNDDALVETTFTGVTMTDPLTEINPTDSSKPD